jgi:hypothetical protein
MPHVIVKLWPGKSESQKTHLAEVLLHGDSINFTAARVSDKSGRIRITSAHIEPRNPMGAAARVLVDNELAIHGTNNPVSIGIISWGLSAIGLHPSC